MAKKNDLRENKIKKYDYRNNKLFWMLAEVYWM